MLIPARGRSLLLAGIALAAAGCGSSAKKTATVPAASSPAAVRILNQASVALAHVHSFRLTGSETDAAGSTSSVSGVVVPGVGASLTFGSATGTVTLLDVHGNAFVYGDTTFYAATNLPTSIAKAAANHWTLAPASLQPQFASLQAVSTVGLAGRCLLEQNIGTLVYKGIELLNGRRVNVIADLGNRPGSAPGAIYIAASGVPLPVRVTQLGPVTLGAKPDAACAETASDIAGGGEASDLLFSAYNSPQVLAAPASPINVAAMISAAEKTK